MYVYDVLLPFFSKLLSYSHLIKSWHPFISWINLSLKTPKYTNEEMLKLREFSLTAWNQVKKKKLLYLQKAVEVKLSQFRMFSICMFFKERWTDQVTVDIFYILSEFKNSLWKVIHVASMAGMAWSRWKYDLEKFKNDGPLHTSKLVGYRFVSCIFTIEKLNLFWEVKIFSLIARHFSNARQ